MQNKNDARFKHMAIRSKIPFITAAALGMIRGFLSLGISALLALAVRVSLRSGETNFQTFGVYAVVYYVVYMLLFSAERLSHANAVRYTRVRLKERLFRAFLWQSPGSRAKKKKGDVLAQFHNLTNGMENDYYLPLLVLVRNLAVITVSMSAILVYQWYFGILCVFIFGIYLLLTGRINKSLETIQENLMRNSMEESNEMTVMLRAFQTATDYGAADYFEKRFAKAVKASDLSYARLGAKYNLLGVIGVMIEPVITLAIIVGYGIMVRLRPDMSVAGALAMTQLASSMLHPIGSIGEVLAQIKSTKALRQMIKQSVEEAQHTFLEWSQSVPPLPDVSELSMIEIGFSYEESAVLSQINLSLKAGKKYALVGRSGGGKTTLVNLLTKMLIPTEGKIFWNSLDYCDITRGDLIHSIAYVGQDPFMVPTDVRTNIVGGQMYEEERLFFVLACSRLIVGMTKEEVNQFLDSPASQLSVGEKKRVALAGALYTRKKILILDEFTSSVSEDMAQEMEDTVLALDDVLVIHITHHPDPERKNKYDEVIVVE